MDAKDGRRNRSKQGGENAATTRQSAAKAQQKRSKNASRPNMFDSSVKTESTTIRQQCGLRRRQKL
ncbi:hypothetical protein BTO02_15105 [Paraburkholderia sp. SOS3]|jgi:hypothetical protein|nr:hypothetical protein BTO02_15105 [Paraburkholderia sp. SOS3]